MFAKHILSDYEKGEIVEGSLTRLSKNEKLIDSIMRRGPSGFGVFCDVLESSSNHTLVLLGRNLRQVSYRPYDESKRLDDSWNHQMLADTQEQLKLGRNADEKPKLKDLVRLNIQGEWYDLGLQLDVDQETLDTIQYNHKHDIREMRRGMLNAWLMQASPKDATWKTMIKALRSIDTRVNVDSVVKELHLDSDTQVD